jgi:hypothetical protein
MAHKQVGPVFGQNLTELKWVLSAYAALMIGSVLNPYGIMDIAVKQRMQTFHIVKRLSCASSKAKNLFMIFQLPIFPNSIWFKKLTCTNHLPIHLLVSSFFTSFQFFQAHDSRPDFLRASFLGNVKKWRLQPFQQQHQKCQYHHLQTGINQTFTIFP